MLPRQAGHLHQQETLHANLLAFLLPFMAVLLPLAPSQRSSFGTSVNLVNSSFAMAATVSLGTVCPLPAH